MPASYARNALTALPFAAVLAGGLRHPVWAAGGLFALWALAALSERRPSWRAAGPWAAWAAWTLLAALSGPEPLVSLPGAARAASAALVFALARAWSEEEAEAWIVALVGLGLAVGTAALFTGARAFMSGVDLAGAAVSMTGFIPPYYNYSAFVVAAAAAAAFACALAPGASGGARRSWALACFLLLVVLAFSRSRGAQLGFLAGGALIAARAGGRRAVLALCAAGLAAAFAVGAKLGASNQRRASIWSSAWEAAAEKPLLGHGPERFGAAFDLHPFVSGVGLARYQMTTLRAHSEPLEAAATTGLLGGFLWLFCALAPLGGAFLRKERPAAREAALAAGAAMTAQLFVDNMLQLPGLALLWAAALGACAPSKPAPASSGARWPAFAGLAALACLLAFVPPAALKEGERRLEGLDAPSRERLAREALRLSPASSAWREIMGEALLAQGKKGEAVPELIQALELRPGRPFPALSVARAAASEGRWDRTLEYCGRALSAEPDFLAARLLRAEALLRTRRKPEARAELAEAARRHAELDARAESAWMTSYDKALIVWDEQAFKALSRRAR